MKRPFLTTRVAVFHRFKPGARRCPETPMKLPRRQFLHLAASAAALPALSRIARAQVYPSRPVRIVVGFPPGGANDTYAHLIAQRLSERPWSAVHRRKPARCWRQYWHRNCCEGRWRRLHASVGFFSGYMEPYTLFKSQVQLPSRHRASFRDCCRDGCACR